MQLPTHAIYYASAPCSTGKTFAACEYICERRTSTNHLYVAPSRELLKETAKQLEDRGVKADVITSDTDPGAVKGSIIRYFNSALDFGHILLITWNAFIDLPYVNRRQNWTVIVDELPQVDQFHRLMLPRNHRFLTEHLQLLPLDITGLSLVIPKDQGRLKRLLDAPHDDVDEGFRALFRDVLSANKIVYADEDSWTRVVERQEISKEHEGNRIFFLSMLNPSLLKGCIVLGANVQDSLLWAWFSSQKAQFKEVTDISRRLRPLPDLGRRLRISYCVPGRNFSKHLGKMETAHGRSVIETMDELVRKEFTGRDFLYMGNKDRESSILSDMPGMVEASVISHGLNSYQHISNIYFSAALNREPKHFAMLRSLGLSPDVVHRATAHETIYQGVMRTSLRNPDSSELVHAIVPDQASAERLGELLGCSNIRQLGDVLPPPRRAFTAAEKSQRCRFLRVKEQLFAAKRNQGLL